MKSQNIKLFAKTQNLISKGRQLIIELRPTTEKKDQDWLGRKQKSGRDWLGRKQESGRDWLGRK